MSDKRTENARETHACDLDDIREGMGYQGCRNCKRQIAPLRMCEWAEKTMPIVLSIICPKWERREDEQSD